MKKEYMTTDVITKHDVYQNVINRLKEDGVDYTILSHTPVYTMEQASIVCDHLPEQGVKVLFIRVYNSKKKYGFALIVWTGSLPIDFVSVSNNILAKKISMATPEEVIQNLGIEIGSLSPFGYEHHFPLIFDSRLCKQDSVYINAGRHDLTIKLSPQNLKNLLIKSGSETFEI